MASQERDIANFPAHSISILQRPFPSILKVAGSLQLWIRPLVHLLSAGGFATWPARNNLAPGTTTCDPALPLCRLKLVKQPSRRLENDPVVTQAHPKPTPH